MADLPTNLQTLQNNAADIALAVDSIATAIAGKGGTLPNNPGLMDFPGAVNSIPGASTLGTKSIVANGTYQAESDNLDGYSSVSVAVPNSYAAGDEGKVVNSGALVAQTAYPSTVTANDTYDTTNYNSITVNVSGGGGGGGFSGYDVKFIDYDGSIVQAYTAAEFAALSAMPANPSHTGLTAQGWNWTLANAKTHVAANGKLDIGQMYTTSDGKSRFYLDITDRDVDITVTISFITSGSVNIYWGDGVNTTATSSGDYTHSYNEGTYTMTIEVSSGTIATPKVASDYDNDCKLKAEIGNGVTSITDAFQAAWSLRYITIPSTVTSISAGAFQYCYALNAITIPSGVTSIGDSTFEAAGISIISMPNTITSIGDYAFSNCGALSYVNIPSGVTTIGDAWQYSGGIKGINIPHSVTEIGYGAFDECYALLEINVDNSEGSIDGEGWAAPNRHCKVNWLR